MIMGAILQLNESGELEPSLLQASGGNGVGSAPDQTRLSPGDVARCLLGFVAFRLATSARSTSSVGR